MYLRNSKYTIFVLFFIIYTTVTFGQISTNKEFLKKYADRKNKQSIDKTTRINEYVSKKNIERHKKYDDGSIGIVVDIVDDEPIYNKPLGLPSLKAMRVDSLRMSGGLNFNLTGTGYDKIGLWESYHPYEHNEYNGKLIPGDGGSSDYNFSHSTATAGIIVGTGLNNQAEGVAKDAKLKVFSIVNRLAEMASEASNGMEIGSYSYETNNYYGSNEANVDTIAYAGPNFLLFQAAGNDDRDISGKVLGQQKNSLTIGAVKILNPPHYSSNEIIRGSSSMGPTIDGRIKPDLVAPFYNDDICNQLQTSGYTTNVAPATSWSTAAAAGVGALVQQYYQDTHNQQVLKSSTLKALLIHTAFEAGDRGPDYKFGWGMINAKDAIKYVMIDKYYDNTIKDVALNDGETYQKIIKSDGSKQIKVTICWNDPPAAASNYLDGNKKLINDLDLRIKKDGQVFYPWILDPDNPFIPATFGDNQIDNVEQIIIDDVQSGNYTVEVTNKGSLSNDGILSNGTQLFSIIFSGERNCENGSIIYNENTNKFNFCKDGYWIEK